MSDIKDLEVYAMELDIKLWVPPGVARDRFFKLLATATDPRKSHETAHVLRDLVDTPGVLFQVADVSVGQEIFVGKEKKDG